MDNPQQKRFSHRPSEKTQWPWMHVLLFLSLAIICVVSGLIINWINNRSDLNRQAEVLLGLIHQKSHQLSAIEWRAIAEKGLSDELKKEVSETRQTLNEVIDQFQRLGLEPKTYLSPLVSLYRTYIFAVDEEFRFLEAGNFEEAEKIDRQMVDPTFSALSNSIQKISSALSRMAENGQRQAKEWTIGVLLFSCGFVFLLLWKFNQTQEKVKLALVEKDILQATNKTLEERVQQRTMDLEALHTQIASSSRRVGMAQVANSILHNLGNALNSVNTSTSFLLKTLNQSRMIDLPAAAGLLQSHSSDLTSFLTHHPQGSQFPQYLTLLSKYWEEEHQTLLKELQGLSHHLQHIHEIVRRQQDLSGSSEIMEPVNASEAIQDSIFLTPALQLDASIQLHLECPRSLTALSDKPKLVQILVNLLHNAIDSLDEFNPTPKKLAITAEKVDDQTLRIQVTDNGIGIPSERLSQIFSYGFTTKVNGHGFGLHGSAISARDLGGQLEVTSPGHGLGATFTLQLPAFALNQMEVK